MIRHLFFVTAVAGTLLMTGCASVVNGHTQSVSVTTKSRGEPVSGAQCSLSNDKGVWYLTSPGSVSVHRSYGGLTVSCALAGLPDGVAAASSSTTAAVFGNILVGGVIGAGVDIATGAAYNYPNVIPVDMGRTTVVHTVPPTGKGEAPAAVAPDPAMAAAKVPYLNEGQQAQYRLFLTRPLPRAFAISANGHYASMYTTAPFDKSLPTDPKERALLVCSRMAGTSCELYAVDNQIVFQDLPARPQPAGVRTRTGKYEPDATLAATRVPFLNEGQQAEYQIFLTHPTPRAFAISENGHYATAWSNVALDKSMPSDPKERALLSCKRFAGRDCQLFVVDNEIVYRAP